MKKFIFLILFLFISVPFSSAEEVPVKIKPVKKITTSNYNFQVGDSVDFIVAEDVLIGSKLYIRRGEKVEGIISERLENDYFSIPAKLYMESFKTKNTKGMPVKLIGVIYKSGNNHKEIMEFLDPAVVRGGEVQIEPYVDEFTLFVEGNL